MRKMSLIIRGKKADEKNGSKVYWNGIIIMQINTCLFQLALIFLLAGFVYSASDEALFIDEAGNLKLQKGVPVNEFSSDVTLEGNSDRAIPTEKAVKTYIDNKEKALRDSTDSKDKEVRILIENKLQKEYLRKGGQVVGEHLKFVQCGGRYRCTPIACLQKCISLGLRMATYSEVYAWASGGKNHCAYMWMLRPENGLYKAYPMYSNQTKEGCGRTGTGNIPRMLGNEKHGWYSKAKADCACSSLK
jgi:hypothetical protein